MKEPIPSHSRPKSKSSPVKLAAALLALGLGGGGYLCAKSFEKPEIVRALPLQKVGIGKPEKDPLGDVNARTRRRIGDVAGVLDTLIMAAERRARVEPPPIPPDEKELYDLLLRFAESGDIAEINEFMGRMENLYPTGGLYGVLSRVLDRIPSNGPLMKKIVTSCIEAENIRPPSVCANAVIRIAGMSDGVRPMEKGVGSDADTQRLLTDVFERGANHFVRSRALSGVENKDYILGMADHASRLGMNTQQDRDFVTEVARGLVMNAMDDRPEQQSALDGMIKDPKTNSVVREAAVESSSDVDMLKRYAFMDNEKCDSVRFQGDTDSPEWQEAYDNDQLRFAARRRLREMGLLAEADFSKGVSYRHSEQ